MTIKITSQQLLSTADADFRNRLAMADIIGAEFPNGERRSFWKRPIDEVVARGGSVAAILIYVADDAEFAQCQAAVDRIKNS